MKTKTAIFIFNAYLYDINGDVKEKKQFKVRSTNRGDAYVKAYKIFPESFIELYSII